MIKVLYVIDTLKTGGAEKSLVDIALHNKEVSACFVTIYGGNDFKSILNDNGIPCFDLEIKNRYAFKEASQKLVQLLSKIQPDVIHSTLFRADMVARKAIKKYQIPLISSFVNNSYVKDRYDKLNLVGKLKLKVVQYVDRHSADKTDYFISNSQTIKDSNAEFLKVNPTKIQVIYRGRSTDKFNPDLYDKVSIRRNLGAADGSFVFLNVSRLLQRKGQIDLIKAFAIIVEKYPQAVLWIAGEGGFRKELETTIEVMKLQNNIRLLGNRNDIPNLLAAADCFVFPSYYEGLPGALIEAMLSRKIIICSNIPENKECVTTNSAIMFEKGNIAQLSQAMITLMGNEEKFCELGNEAYEEAILKFDINTVVSQYNTVYRKMILRN